MSSFTPKLPSGLPSKALSFLLLHRLCFEHEESGSSYKKSLAVLKVCEMASFTSNSYKQEVYYGTVFLVVWQTLDNPHVQKAL